MDLAAPDRPMDPWTAAPAGGHARGSTGTASSPGDLAAWLPVAVLRAIAVAAVGGVALGVWCREWAEGAAGPAGVLLASIGAPWMAVAFAVGCLGVAPSTDPVRRAVTVLAGATAGAASLVVASLAYYEDLGPSTVAWSVIGTVVGGVLGSAGAVVRSWPGTAAAGVAATGFGVAVAAEGFARIGSSWWLDGDPSVQAAIAGVAAAGVLAPVAIAGGRLVGWLGAGAVLVLATPLAGLVAYVASSPGFG